MIFAQLYHTGMRLGARLCAHAAAGMERAAGREVLRIRHPPGNGVQPFSGAGELWNGIEQSGRIGVGGILKYLPDRSDRKSVV